MFCPVNTEKRLITTDILIILTVSSRNLRRLSTIYPDHRPRPDSIAFTLDTLMHKITTVPSPELSPRVSETTLTPPTFRPGAFLNVLPESALIAGSQSYSNHPECLPFRLLAKQRTISIHGHHHRSIKEETTNYINPDTHTQIWVHKHIDIYIYIYPKQSRKVESKWNRVFKEWYITRLRASF